MGDDTVQGRISLKIDGEVAMLAMGRKTVDFSHDISFYAKDSRLTGEPDGKRYKWTEMIERFKMLGRPLTEEEAEEFRVQ